MRQLVPVLVKLCLIGVLLTATAWAQAGSDYTIDTINGIRRVGDGGVASSADLQFPSDVAVDGDGNLYIADSGNHRVHRVDPMGMITTIAGTGEAGFSGDGGLAVAAELGYLRRVAVDSAGNVYIISETNDHRVRRVDPSGMITTIAGTGEAGFSGDGDRGGSAQLDSPRDVAADRAGELYIADTRNNRIRRVDPSGIITTIAGTGEAGFSGDSGPATEAMLNRPTGVVVDDAGTLYIADTGNKRVRRVDASGTISTVADPSDSAGVSTVDRAGNLYFSAWPHLVRRMDPSGTIVTVAGTRFFHAWRGGFSGDGGPAVAAELHYPLGLAVDGVGNLYIADQENFRIRRVDAWGIISTVSGPFGGGRSGDCGPATEALVPPTGLTAMAVSSSRVKLAWRDNSTHAKCFRIERRVDGSSDWVGIGTTTSNATTFLDEGLEPLTAYHYRVQGFNITGVSAFSNETSARTREALPATLTGFTPTSGPVGAGVTLTGTHLFEVTGVLFNGVPAARFKVLSGTSIEATVPMDATSGPISVIAPAGTTGSERPFTLTDIGIRSRLFVPIVLSTRGKTAGSFFTSELTLTNRGSKRAAVKYTYTAANGTGSGTALDFVWANGQLVISDAIVYLTALGVPIGSGSAGGTLVVDFSNLSSPSDAAVTVRVGTPVEEGSGRAGLAYPGLNPGGLLTGPAFITGLRQNSQDRSNVALQNAGDSSDGNLTLRVTVFSGDSAEPGRSEVLPDLTLPPGGFHQYDGILNTAGFDNGYVKVERVEGTAPFYAYGAINDNFNSDGSFVFPVREDSLVGKRGQTLPVIIETKDFTSELTVTNFSPVAKTVDFRFVAEAVETDDNTAGFSLRLEAGEQRILPQVIDWLRQREVAGIGTADEAFVGAVFATVPEGDMSGIVIGARTSSPDGSGGQYGVFYFAVPYGSASIDSAWIYGLQQNEKNRSNVALVNTGEVDDSISTFEIDVFEIDHYSRAISRGGFPAVRTLSKTVGPRGWLQINRILGDSRQGYVQVRKVSGNNPFITYGVINDGGKPGQRSGDGAFLPSQE